MKPKKRQARIAGLLYLLLGITGMIGLGYLPLKIIVPGDITATARNISTSAFLFRLDIVSNLVSQTLFIFLVLALYHLFKEVNRRYAILMVSLVIVSVPIAFIAVLNQLGVLLVLNGADFQNVFSQDQQNALAMLFLKLYEHGNSIAEIFWGLWLFPFGYLTYKSGFIPKIFGILLMIACFGYLASSFTVLLFPEHIGLVSPFTMVTGTVGEFSIIFWLLIKGVRDSQPAGTGS